MHSSSEKYEGIALAFSEMMPKSKQHYTRSKNEYVLPSDGGPDAILTQSPFNSGIRDISTINPIIGYKYLFIDPSTASPKR